MKRIFVLFLVFMGLTTSAMQAMSDAELDSVAAQTDLTSVLNDFISQSISNDIDLVTSDELISILENFEDIYGVGFGDIKIDSYNFQGQNFDFGTLTIKNLEINGHIKISVSE